MPLVNISRPNKIPRYTPDPIVAVTYVAYGNSVSNSTAPSNPQIVTILNDDDPNNHNITMREDPGHGRGKYDTALVSMME